jgi:hypothetical protein
MFKHAKCEGELTINLGGQFTICSPSISIAVEGLTIGVLEIMEAGSKETKNQFVCKKCHETITDLSSIEILCEVCRKYHPVRVMSVARNVGALCQTDLDILRGNKEPTTERQKYYLRYIRITEDMQVVPASSVMSKPVNSI